MNKFILILALFLLSCGDHHPGSTNRYYLYGSELLPFLPELEGSYQPLGLKERVIIKDDVRHVPIDIVSLTLSLTFDVSAHSIIGRSQIRFKVTSRGRPFFELKAAPKEVLFNDLPVTTSAIQDPDGQTQSYWSLDKEVTQGENEVEIVYDLPKDRASFNSSGVRFLTDMTDLRGRFFEHWGPVGFESDQFSMKVVLKVLNATSSHHLFTNGTTKTLAEDEWSISFPPFFTSSSFYVHLTNAHLPQKEFTYQGIERDIPIMVYGLSSELVDNAVFLLPGLFAELEQDFGPYPHEKFLAYLNDRSGGMEYVGATITSIEALDHELLHSWFGRSVIPADGRSGWIDEAIASWRDWDYFQSPSRLQRTPTNLSNYSPFRKTTPDNSYKDGRALLAELDREFASYGGMKPILKLFFGRYKNRIITNDEFWSYLKEQTNSDVEAFKLRYTLGVIDALSQSELSDLKEGKHPPPLTEAEVLRLR